MALCGETPEAWRETPSCGHMHEADRKLSEIGATPSETCTKKEEHKMAQGAVLHLATVHVVKADLEKLFNVAPK